MLTLLLSLLQHPIDIAKLDALVKAKDVAGLSSYLVEPGARNPFNVIRTGGPYGGGSKGWSALPLKSPDGADYVVFSTIVIAEDIGELLFLVEDGKLRYVPEKNFLGVVPESHSFDVRFDLPNHKAFIVDNAEFTRVSRDYSHFVFRFSPTFKVRSIKEGTRDVQFAQAGGVVAVQVPKIFDGIGHRVPDNGGLKLKIAYDGTVEMPVFDKQISEREATLTGSFWYPQIARKPAPYDITFHIPKNWTALGQGEEVFTRIEGDEKVTKFRMNTSVVWYSASCGPFKTVVRKVGSKEYATMSPGMDEAAMALENEINPHVVEFYAKRFWAYPFKRWTALDSWQFRGGPGALEAYSYATYPGGLPHWDAHEPAHTWWGGILNNDYLKSFWNESFATFCSGMFLRESSPGNVEEKRLAFVSSWFPAPIYDEAPLNDSGGEIGPAAAALGYGKGADVMQVLEDELGPDRMARCMRDWMLRAAALQQDGQGLVGSWESFEEQVNKTTGKNYGWFFDQWVRRPGLPNFTLESADWESGKFTGTLRNDGMLYRISFDAMFVMPDAKRVFKRVSPVPAAAGQNIGQLTFTVDLAENPTMFVLDPWNKVPRKDAGARQAVSLQGYRPRQVFVDAAHPSYIKWMQGGSPTASVPSDLNGVALFGNPTSSPALATVCEKAGFVVVGDKLTYRGTTVDLKKGGAVAVVDLGDGKRCLLGLGTSRVRPEFGRARLVVFDDLGRCLRAVTEPVTSGSLTWTSGR